MSRNVADRIHWFLTNHPGTAGMCLRHTWQATAVPYVGIPDANAGWAYVKVNGHLHTDRNIPRGAWVWYSSPSHGHVGIALGDGMLASTDVHGPGTTGRVPDTWPEQIWGHTYQGWSDWYGETFTTEGDDMPLTKDDVDRIAKAVWLYELENETNDPKQRKPAGWFLNAILGKVKGK